MVQVRVCAFRVLWARPLGPLVGRWRPRRSSLSRGESSPLERLESRTPKHGRVIFDCAKVFGESAAVAVLEEGEDHGRDDYKRELKDVSPEVRALIETELLPAQLQTHDAVSRDLSTSSRSPRGRDRRLRVIWVDVLQMCRSGCVRQWSQA